MFPRIRLLLTLAAALAMAAACTGFVGLGGPLTVTMSEHELDERLQRRLPFERRLLEVFDVTVPAARLRLLPETNRLAMTMDVRARERLRGGTWQGQLALEGALHWNAPDQTVRLTKISVLDFKVEGSATPGRTAVQQVGVAMAEHVLEGFVVYKLPAERAARLQEMGLTPGAVTVTSRGLEITFVKAGG